MTNISFAILRRLALAATLACLVVGTGFYVIQEHGVDSFILALATQHPDDLASFRVEQDRQAAYADVLEAAYPRSVIVQVFDKDWVLRGESANPRFEDIRAALMAQTQDFPRDMARHYHIIHSVDAMAIQVQAPILDEREMPVGFLGGILVVPEQVRQELQQRIQHVLLALFIAVFLTAAALYPMILSLNRKVLRASHLVMRGNLEMAGTLGTAIAKRDSETGAHNFRVCYYALHLGEAVKLDVPTMRRLIVGSFFHDIGKIGVSDTVLLKPGKLDDEEFAAMKKHVPLGMEIIKPSEWLRAGSDVIECHHEKFDGSGYPRQLQGEEIPLVARIFAIADVFDALTSRRPYKEPMPGEEAILKVREEAGSHFDPDLVEVFAGIATRLHGEISPLSERRMNEVLMRRTMSYFLQPGKTPPLQ
ncbi:MAG: HD-GYP domain-containing protein [Betaproteobacteria bacterium]|nr:HD-GYP domain-containing protein [Betaproteobacteria bacterium]